MSVVHNTLSSDDGRTDVWLTPSFVIDALGGWESFDLDPSAPEIQPWPTAKMRYTETDNGLILPWNGRIWLNPPYSIKLLSEFMSKMADHNHGTALIFARTDTKIFFDTVWDRASAVLFLRNRIHFHNPEGKMSRFNSGAPSVLVAYGLDDADILAAEPIQGQFIPLRIPRNWLIEITDRSWRDALNEFFSTKSGPVELKELYEAFANDPKAKNNPNYRAKLRQTLQRAQYVNVGKGVWTQVARA